MGRVRKELSAAKIQRTGQKYSIIFKHPLTNKTTRCMLGRDGEEDENLRALNRVFVNPLLWHNLPKDTPECVRLAWEGVSAETDDKPHKVTKPDSRFIVPQSVQRERDRRLARVTRENAKLRKQNEILLGRKARVGPCPTIAEAINSYMQRYTGRDSDHTKNVRNMLNRFAAKFGAETLVDKVDGCEAEIDSWLRGLKTKRGTFLSAGVRQQMRIYIIDCLEMAGLRIDRNALPSATAQEIRNTRGAIRWLERSQAERLAKKLKKPWSDCFRVQVGTGLRPDELITLTRANFNANLTLLSLAPLGHLSLKHGSRTIRIPPAVQKIVRERLKKGTLLFPDERSGEPWINAKLFDKHYRAALKKAEEAARIPFTCDCRIGRRTCASLLLRSGLSAEEVAALLGTSAKMIKEHYAAILAPEVSTHAAALTA